MSGNLIAIIVILVLLLVLAGIIYYAYCNIRKKLRDTSRMLFGTDSMIEGMKQRKGSGNDTEVGLFRNQPVHAVHYAGFPGISL